MFSRIVLYIGNHQLAMGLWTGFWIGRCSWCRLKMFSAIDDHAAGHAQFLGLLQQYSRTPIHILLDTADEDYSLETLPHCNGRTRQALAARKLGQHFRDTPYRAAQFIGRNRHGRKDDRFLLMALRNPQRLEAWMDIIVAAKAPLAGIALLSMVSQQLLNKALPRGGTAKPALLLSELLNSGLRQSYLVQGRLQFSRLIPLTANNQQQVAQFYLTETEKTRLYLSSQRLLARDAELSQMITLYAENTAAPFIAAEAGLPLDQADLRRLAGSMHLPSQDVHHHPELLHMHLLAKGMQIANLATPASRQHYRQQTLGYYLHAMTAAVLSVGLALAAASRQTSLENEAATKQLARDILLQEQLNRQASHQTAPLPVAINDLQAITETGQAVQAHEASLQRTLQTISRALNHTPEIQLNRLRWQLAKDMQNSEEDNIPQQSAALQKDSAAKIASLASDTAGLYNLAWISGEISSFDGDYQQAQNSVQRLADQLQADHEVAHVRLLQIPVNMNSHSRLQGSTVDELSFQPERALFSLKLILKP